MNNKFGASLEQLIGMVVRRINEGINKGCTKEDILHYFIRMGKESRVVGQETDFFERNLDIIERITDVALLGMDSEKMQFEIQRLYQRMVEENNLSFADNAPKK